jgi:hypothetical protein
MCLAPEPGKAYYRPFICKGDLSKGDIFFVGINPATPIFPKHMEIDKYVDLLLNYEEFLDYAIPYPTANLKALKKEPRFVLEKGKDIFYSLVTEFKPSLIILHGKKSVEQAIDSFVSRGLIAANSINNEQSIEEMEQQAPLIQFKYSNGKTGVIMACRHFLYYGSKGDSFEPFRRMVLKILKRDLFHLLK